MNIIGLIVLVVLFVVHWKLSIIGQSIILHRGATHEQFTFTKSKYLRMAYWYLFFVMGSSYLSPRAYAILHRMHHRYADTDKDPHKPTKSYLGPLLMMKNTAKSYSDAYRERINMRVGNQLISLEEEHKKGSVISWPSFDSIAHSFYFRIGWGIVYVIFYTGILLLFNLPLWLLPLVSLHIMMGPIHGMIVNYYAHLYGSQEHTVSNTSRNMHPTIRFVLQLSGELFHNNHHRYPESPDFSLSKGVDGSFIIMKWLENNNIISINKMREPIIYHA